MVFPVDVSLSFNTLFGLSAFFSNIRCHPFAELDAGRQRTMVRKFATACKHQGGALSSASKVGAKVGSKGKNNIKDVCLSKTGMGHPSGISNGSLLRPLPPPCHGVGKGLMMGKCSVAPNAV